MQCVFEERGPLCDYWADSFVQKTSPIIYNILWFCVIDYYYDDAVIIISCMASGGYVEVSESEWRALPASYSRAAHVMIYAHWPGRFLDKYDYRYAVSVRRASVQAIRQPSPGRCI